MHTATLHTPKRPAAKRSWATVPQRHPYWVFGIAAVLVLLVAGRLYLPVWATGYVNRQMSELKNYTGSVDDIDISLWRGAYQIQGMNIFKTQNGQKQPFVAARNIDLSVQWGALIHGRIVAEIEMDDINLTFSPSQSGAGESWAHFIDSLSPFQINRLQVNGGKIAFVDKKADLYIDDVSGSVTNLRNVEDKGTPLPSVVDISGNSIGKGRVNIAGRINILHDIPDFDMNMKLENAALPAFNNYTREAVAVDFSKGTGSVYSELAAADGHVTGYIKFIANGMSIADVKGQKSNPLKMVWEGVVATFMNIFKNHPKDQFALRIPVDGNLNNPHKNGLAAFFSIFSNAFGKAFPRDTDGSIDFNDALKKSNQK